MKKILIITCLTFFFISCNNGDPEGFKKRFNLVNAVEQGSELTLYDKDGKPVASYEVVSRHNVETESKPVASISKEDDKENVEVARK